MSKFIRLEKNSKKLAKIFCKSARTVCELVKNRENWPNLCHPQYSLKIDQDSFQPMRKFTRIGKFEKKCLWTGKKLRKWTESTVIRTRHGKSTIAYTPQLISQWLGKFMHKFAKIFSKFTKIVYELAKKNEIHENNEIVEELLRCINSQKSRIILEKIGQDFL